MKIQINYLLALLLLFSGISLNGQEAVQPFNYQSTQIIGVNSSPDCSIILKLSKGANSQSLEENCGKEGALYLFRFSAIANSLVLNLTTKGDEAETPLPIGIYGYKSDSLYHINCFRHVLDGSNLELDSLVVGNSYLLALQANDTIAKQIELCLSVSPDLSKRFYSKTSNLKTDRSEEKKDVALSRNGNNSDTFGYSGGNFTVNQNGGASYIIPLMIPAGTSGMMPELQLSYNSNSGNSILGNKFNISGFSIINRVGQNYEYDGRVAAPSFFNDKYALNGNRLVNWSPTLPYGHDGCEYRTEKNAHSKIVSYGKTPELGSTNPERFKVWTKGGVVYEYGFTEDSKIEAKDRAEVQNWLVNKITDTKGNEINFRYTEDTEDGFYYPLAIDYVSNEATNLSALYHVEFEYETRPDIIESYLHGAVTRIDKRMKKILVKYNNTIIRSYTFEYQNNPLTKKSEIISLQECGLNGECLNPTLFEWQENNSFEDLQAQVITDAIPMDSLRYAIDYIQHLKVISKKVEKNWFRKKTTTKYKVYLEEKFTLLEQALQSTGDIDGDGLNDIIIRFPKENGSNYEWYPFEVFKNSGNYNFPESETNYIVSDGNTGEIKNRVYHIAKDVTNYEMFILDINSDSYQDFIFYDTLSGTNIWHINKSGPLGNNGDFNKERKLWYDFEIKTNIIPPSLIRKDNNGIKFLAFNDYNGDGLPDLTIATENGKVDYYIKDQKGDGFLPNPGTISTSINTGRHINMDFNGDGLEDIVVIRDNNVTYWYENKSIAYPTPKIEYKYVGTNKIAPADLPTNYQAKPGDFNGDGLQDIMVYEVDNEGDLNSNSIYVTIFFNKGDLTFRKSSRQSLIGVGNPTSFDSPLDWWLTPMDVTGDGLSDLVTYNNITGNMFFHTNLYNEYFPLFGEDMPTFFGFRNAPFDRTLMSGGGGISPISARNGSLFSVKWYDVQTGKNRIFDLDADLTKNDIKKIKTGHGQEIEIDYDFTTNQDIYRREEKANYPEIDYVGPKKVVSTYYIHGGGQTIQNRSFKYKYGKLNVWGKGFRGFKEFHDIDNLTGEVSKSYLRTSFYESPLEKAEKFDRTGKKVSEYLFSAKVDTIYSPKGKPTYYSYMNKTTEQFFSDESVYRNTTIIKKEEHDEFGNAIYLEVDYPDLTQYNEEAGASNIKTYSTFSNDDEKWIIGRLTSSRVVKSNKAGTSSERKVAFEYNQDDGLLMKEIAHPDGGQDRIETIYERDAYGNIIKKSMKAWNGFDFETRNTLTEFDQTGSFETKVSNDLGHTVRMGYDQRGLKVFNTDINGLITIYDYDDLGRSIRVTRPDGTFSAMEYKKCTTGCPNGAATYIKQSSSIGPDVIVYNDAHDREILTETTGYDGKKIFSETQYDNIGRLFRVSDPYFENDTKQWTLNEYDNRHRVIATVSPGNIRNSVEYKYLETIYTNPLGQKKTVKTYVNGNNKEVIDNLGAKIEYQYDIENKLVLIRRHADGYKKYGDIAFEYDFYGQRTKIIDPEMGTYSYKYNRFNELLEQTYPSGKKVLMEYDKLSRLTKRIEEEGITTTIYDTAPKGIGKVSNIDSYSSNTSYTYDNLSRPKTESYSIDEQTYTTTTEYDNFGRIDQFIYPSDITLKYTYDTQSILDKIQEASTGYTYYDVEDMDAYGRITKEKYGNNVVNESTFDAQKGFLLTQKATFNNEVRQHFTYTHDNLANLTSRTNHYRNFEETFTYDRLNRLTKYSIPNVDETILEYDFAGNITYKSDVGQYEYGSNSTVTNYPSPYQLISITQNEESCTPNSTLAKFDFTSFDKVSAISNDSTRIEFTYGASRQRVQTHTYVHDELKEKKTYLGSAMEITTDELGNEHKRIFIRGVAGVIAVVNVTTHNGTYTHFWHKDHLGSLQTVTDATGNFEEDFFYDPWGKRKNPITGGALEGLAGKQTYDRGYTGHEHIDLFDLINMNGRIQDPVLGRFISPDPIIQNVTNLQNLNRYSYVMNNPLKYSDPSGFMAQEENFTRKENFRLQGETLDGKQIDITGNFLVGDQVHTDVQRSATLLTKVIQTTIQIVVSATPAGPIAGAAVSAFTGSILTGYSLETAIKASAKAALWASISAGAANLVGSVTTASAISNGFLRAGAKGLGHGLAQGLIGKAQGGKFWSGAAAGFASGIGESLTQAAMNKQVFKPGGVAHYGSAALIGGTASSLAGGKFLDGAITATLVVAYNQLSPQSQNSIKQKADEMLPNKADCSNGCLGQADSNTLNRPPNYWDSPQGRTALTIGEGTFEATSSLIQTIDPVSGFFTTGIDAYIALDKVDFNNPNTVINFGQEIFFANPKIPASSFINSTINLFKNN